MTTVTSGLAGLTTVRVPGQLSIRPTPSRVAVIIPCRDEAKSIEMVLESIRAQDLRPDEVVIIDGGSADRTMFLVQDYAARHPDLALRIVEAPGAGIAAALNKGIEATSADVIVRIDAHSRPAPDYVRRAMEALNETDAAVVGGIWHITPGAASPASAAIAVAVAHPLGAGNAAYRLPSSRSKGRRAADTVPFGCFRRSHWVWIGGYNEELQTNEDYEFNYRTRQAGGAVVVDPAIRCEYFARPTFLRLARQYFRYGWWKGRMLWQHPQSIQLRQAIPALFIPGWATLGVIAAAVPSFRPAAALLLGLYLLVLLVFGLRASSGVGRLGWRTAVAFLTIHGAWSAGIALFFLAGAPRTGYPRWTDRLRRTLSAR